MNYSKRQSYIRILRWLFFLPISVLVGHLVFLISQFAIISTLQLVYIDPDSYFGLLLVRAFSGLLLGSALIYTAILLIPNYRRNTTIIIAGLFVIIVSFTISSAVIEGAYLESLEQLAMLMGGLGVVYSIYNGDKLT